LQIIIRAATSNAIYTPPEGGFWWCDRADQRAIKGEEAFKRPKGNRPKSYRLTAIPSHGLQGFPTPSTASALCQIRVQCVDVTTPSTATLPRPRSLVSPNQSEPIHIPLSDGFCLVHCAFDWPGP